MAAVSGAEGIEHIRTIKENCGRCRSWKNIMGNKYYVAKASAGYVVYEQGHIMPLPFNWMSQSGAYEACEIFNDGGYRAVAEYYYVHKVAGTRDIRYMLEKGINPYDEWMSKNGDMFKRD